jgi:serine protease AprX
MRRNQEKEMRNQKPSPITAVLTSLSLVLSLIAGIMVSSNAHAKSAKSQSNAPHVKVSSDLLAKAHGAKGADVVPVIVQLNGPMSGGLNALLNSNGVHGAKKTLKNLSCQVIEMPASIVEAVSQFDEVAFVSPDRPTQSTGHLSATTGADIVRSSVTTTSTTTGPLGVQVTTTSVTPGLDGTGIGIAVLDSGLYQAHTNFFDKGNNVRVIYSKDFTGENRVDDPYGHGSHVASIAAGNGRVSNAAYLGIAPNANLVNLRVLNSQGTGTVSGMLAALDWVYANRQLFNIRVVNMSLGTAAVDSYRDDPLCKAVRKLVDAGVIVCCAAGNNGKNSADQKIYGLIHCPGNEPSAITVGAANSFGTDSRGDDGIASYSSRGPTRSYSTDANGVNHYDHLMKPDLVAPGNKIVEAKSPNNLLVAQNPQLDASVSGAAQRDQMYLSGTSMSTPVISGAAALLLQANPNLTPNMVKAILMYTAQPLANFNMLEQGAGEVNIEGAVRLARAMRTDLVSLKPVGGALLKTSTPPTPTSTICGYTFNWSQGIILGRHWARGTSLITKYQPVYALGVIVSDDVDISGGVIVSDGVVISDGVVVSDGVVISDGVIASDGVVISDGVVVSDGLMMGSGVTAFDLGVVVSDSLTDGVIISDGVVVSDGVVISDGVVVSDMTVQAQSAMTGGEEVLQDNVVPDDGTDCLSY